MKEFEKEWKMVKPSDIYVDPLYQRALDTRRVARMAKEYNPNIINPPKLSFRDGKLWVFDGQHTVSLWRQVHKGQDKAIECRVFYGMTWLDESELFCLQNGIDKDPTTNDKLRAAFNMGQPDVVDMVNCARLCNITVDFIVSPQVGRCCATATLYKAYKTLPRAAFIDMLTVINEAWGGEPDSLTGFVISGMTEFYKHYYGRFRQKELLKVLSRTSPAYIIREGKGLTGAAKNKYFRVILKAYNKKRSSGRFEIEE